MDKLQTIGLIESQIQVFESSIRQFTAVLKELDQIIDLADHFSGESSLTKLYRAAKVEAQENLDASEAMLVSAKNLLESVKNARKG